MTKWEAMKTLDVSYSTLKRYVKKGMIRTSKYELPGKKGKQNYWDEDVMALIGRKIHKGHEVVGYIRVNGSTLKDKEKLKDQRARMRSYCNARGISLDQVYEDLAPSTQFNNRRRPQLHSMIKRILEGHIDAVIIDTKCRLFRIGFDLLHLVFEYHGTQLIVMNPALTDEYYLNEQSEDLAKLLHEAGMDRLGKSEAEV